MMTTYDSDNSSQTKEVFAQLRPYHVCRQAGLYDSISEHKGYRVRCRRKSCSIQCLKYWSEQEATINTYFLTETLPDCYRVHRGNLTMPDGASIADHKAAREKFVRALNRHCKGTNRTIRIRCVTDYDDHYGCHYDFTLYADAGIVDDAIKSLVASMWKAAGGYRSSCKPLGCDDDDEVAWSKYAAKDTKAASKYRYVPAHTGLHYTWGTRKDFYLGQSRKELWAEWCKLHFPKMFIARPIKNSTFATNTDTQHDAFMDEWNGRFGGKVKMVRYTDYAPVASWVEDLAARYPGCLEIKEDRQPFKPVSKTRKLLQCLPRSADDALTFPEIMKLMGGSKSEVYKLLNSVPGIVCVQRADKIGAYDDGEWYYSR